MTVLVKMYLKTLFPVKETWLVLQLSWFLLIKWLRTQMLESVLGLLVLALILKLYYTLLNWLKPLVKCLTPKYAHSISYRLSNWFYCQVVPRPKTLLKFSWRILRRLAT